MPFQLTNVTSHAKLVTFKNRVTNVGMNQQTEHAIIAASGTATKVFGTATTASGTVGWIAFLLDHQQIFLLFFAFAGLIITIITAAINIRYQKRKNDREERAHDVNMAVKNFELEQMKAESEKRRRAEDKKTNKQE